MVRCHRCPDAPRHVTHIPLEAGQCLLLYTDGLIERRDEPIERGLKRLRAALTYGTADAICASAMTALPATAPTDDTAILALRKNDDERQ